MESLLEKGNDVITCFARVIPLNYFVRHEVVYFLKGNYVVIDYSPTLIIMMTVTVVLIYLGFHPACFIYVSAILQWCSVLRSTACDIAEVVWRFSALVTSLHKRLFLSFCIVHINIRKAISVFANDTCPWRMAPRSCPWMRRAWPGLRAEGSDCSPRHHRDDRRSCADQA